jgi:hypothetical protein
MITMKHVIRNKDTLSKIQPKMFLDNLLLRIVDIGIGPHCGSTLFIHVLNNWKSKGFLRKSERTFILASKVVRHPLSCIVFIIQMLQAAFYPLCSLGLPPKAIFILHTRDDDGSTFVAVLVFKFDRRH